MMAITKKAVKPSQGAWRLSFAWFSKLAQGRRPDRQAEPEEIQRRQGRHRSGGDEGQESDRRHHCVGQDMLLHDLAFETPSARAAFT